jgi:hypothetical protein
VQAGYRISIVPQSLEQIHEDGIIYKSICGDASSPPAHKSRRAKAYPRAGSQELCCRRWAVKKISLFLKKRSNPGHYLSLEER